METKYPTLIAQEKKRFILAVLEVSSCMIGGPEGRVAWWKQAAHMMVVRKQRARDKNIPSQVMPLRPAFSSHASPPSRNSATELLLDASTNESCVPVIQSLNGETSAFG